LFEWNIQLWAVLLVANKVLADELIKLFYAVCCEIVLQFVV